MSKIDYFFCGIGGAGMSPLARLLAARGKKVAGSDRSLDQGNNPELRARLQREGILLFPQDGSGVTTNISTFVVTRAVESSVPDIKRAQDLNLRILKRPQLMAEMFASSENIAVGGTSGKSTTTGMIAKILADKRLNPTVMNGAVMLDFKSNFLSGDAKLAVFEADESDGHQDVVGLCTPAVAVLTNISLDHFELDSLREIFSVFLKKATRGVVLNAECENSMLLRDLHPNTKTFALKGQADYTAENTAVELSIPGNHNQANALAAIAAASFFGISSEEALRSLKSFSGIHRRLEVVGVANGVTVIDDFASNPGKIAAGIETLKATAKRLFVVFQPHGFQPTKMMKEGYIQTFSDLLRDDDMVVMPEIYYVGGSSNIVDGVEIPLPKDISSRDLTERIGKRAHFIAQRTDIPEFLSSRVQSGDTVVVMGSRDETLSDFAREILARIAQL